MPTAVVITTTVVMTMTFPTATPNREGNRDGMLLQSMVKVPIVAVGVKIPREVLTYCLSPTILSDLMPNCFRRPSRFNARVFSSNAAAAGISTKTCTPPASRVVMSNRDWGVSVSAEIKPSVSALFLAPNSARVPSWKTSSTWRTVRSSCGLHVAKCSSSVSVNR